MREKKGKASFPDNSYREQVTPESSDNLIAGHHLLNSISRLLSLGFVLVS
jgi:hypothetical protein